MFRKISIIVFAALVLLLDSCKPKDNGDNFDRAGLLTNLGNNIILPAHQTLKLSSTNLKQKKDAFTGNPSSVTLDSLKAAFLEAYTAYMAVEVYSFTPSANMRYLNAFATDTAQILANMNSGSYDLNAASNISAKGFPAIDYLLYSRSSAEIINLFTTDANATKRKQYLNDITNEIETVAATAATDWSNYLSQFTSANGTDVGSSVGMLVNDLSYEMERCRRERVGNSLGYIGITSTGVTDPSVLEATYVKYSKELLVENLNHLKQLYEGGTGSGFDDYLVYLNAEYNGQPLAPVISAQFNLVIQKAQNIPTDYGTALSSNNAE